MNAPLPADEQFRAIALEPIYPRPPGRPENCGTCGRFMVWNSHDGGYQCRSIFYDSYAGEWEHD